MKYVRPVLRDSGNKLYIEEGTCFRGHRAGHGCTAGTRVI
jgi:hypothetical protein